MANETLDRALKVLQDYIKDSPTYNKLLGERYENDPTFLKTALFMALDDWNSTPPPIDPVILANHPAKSMLIMGASIWALRSAQIWHARERMPSSDGGTSANDHAKFSQYKSLIDGQISMYETNKLNIKKSIIMNNAFGNFASEYASFRYSGEGLF